MLFNVCFMKSYSCCIVSHMNLFCHFCNQLNHCSLWSNRRPGGEKVYNVFDNQLPAALKRLQFDKHLSMENVRKLITEADGYQPHLIAPEQGYRRLIESSVVSIRGPAEAAVDAVWNKTTIVSSLSNRFMSFISSYWSLVYFMLSLCTILFFPIHFSETNWFLRSYGCLIGKQT